MTIGFILPSLAGGGAERVILNLANGFQNRGFKVYIFLISKNEYYKDEINNSIKLVNLNSERVLLTYFKLKNQLINKKIDILFSTISHLNILMCILKIFSKNIKSSLIIRESNTLSELFSYHNSYKNIFLSFLIKIFYPRADLIIAPSKGVKNDLIENFFIKRELIKVILNPINYDFLKSESLKSVEIDYFSIYPKSKFIIGIGSLSLQKNFSELIKAFSVVKNKYDCKLIILGEGNKRKELENLIRYKKLENDVFMPGWVKNPFAYLSKSDLFVLSSLYEGLPNVLIQALLLKIPCVSVDCKSGPNEILKYGELGILVEPNNKRMLREGIISGLSNKNKNKDIDNEIKKYDLNKVINLYLEKRIFFN